MRRRLLLALLLALLAALLVTRPRPAEEVVPQGVVGVGTPGIDANWREVVTVDVPCDPMGWRNVIVFELRDGDAVVESQETETGCQVACDGDYMERCGEIVAPDWGDVPAGTYQVWYKGLWVNEDLGLEIVSHPPSVTDLDGRGFRRWTEYAVPSQGAASKIKVYLPAVQKASQ